MMTRVAINGFGRIGRLSFMALLQKKQIEVVAINDTSNTATLAHLLKYDSVHGRFKGTVEITSDSLIINGKAIKIYTEKNPSELPWEALRIDTVLESTGIFTDESSARGHLTAGAKKVIISAPAKGLGVPTVVLGVNGEILKGDAKILSNASCTTNCLAPMVRVLDDAFGVEKGYITTVHAYTADQRVQDSPHKDLRRARAAALNIIPTSTGAAKAVGLVLPHLEGKLGGVAMRVPVPDGSLTDLTVMLKKEVTVAAINGAMQKASETTMKGILAYETDPIVSTDIVGNPHSCIFDPALTACNGTLAKVVGWYDNEMGYSHRIADVIELCSDCNGI